MKYIKLNKCNLNSLQITAIKTVDTTKAPLVDGKCNYSCNRIPVIKNVAWISVERKYNITSPVLIANPKNFLFYQIYEKLTYIRDLTKHKKMFLSLPSIFRNGSESIL